MNDSSENYGRRISDLQYEHITEIAQLKIIQSQHSKELRILSESLSTLSDQFKQVKWTVFGAVTFYILQAVGLVDFIKSVFL